MYGHSSNRQSNRPVFNVHYRVYYNLHKNLSLPCIVIVDNESVYTSTKVMILTGLEADPALCTV